MGLDMYLNRHIYVGGYPKGADVAVVRYDWNEQAKPVKNYKDISYLLQQVTTWRKCWPIHNWMVANVQGGVDNCSEYYVDHSQLEDLRDILQACIAPLPDMAGVIEECLKYFDGSDLPTEPEYWGYLVEDFQRTIEVFDKAIEDNSGEYYYSASW